MRQPRYTSYPSAVPQHISHYGSQYNMLSPSFVNGSLPYHFRAPPVTLSPRSSAIQNTTIEAPEVVLEEIPIPEHVQTSYEQWLPDRSLEMTPTSSTSGHSNNGNYAAASYPDPSSHVYAPVGPAGYSPRATPMDVSPWPNVSDDTMSSQSFTSETWVVPTFDHPASNSYPDHLYQVSSAPHISIDQGSVSPPYSRLEDNYSPQRVWYTSNRSTPSDDTDDTDYGSESDDEDDEDYQMEHADNSSTAGNSSTVSNATTVRDLNGYISTLKLGQSELPFTPQREGNRSYACNFLSDQGSRCALRYNRLEHLRRHYNTVHGHVRGHVCRVQSCNRAFSRQDNLNDHYWTHIERNGRAGRNPKMPLRELKPILRNKKLYIRLRDKLRLHQERHKEKKAKSASSKRVRSNL